MSNSSNLACVPGNNFSFICDGDIKIIFEFSCFFIIFKMLFLRVATGVAGSRFLVLYKYSLAIVLIKFSIL